MVCPSEHIDLVVVWTENSDWTIKKVLIDNYLKLFADQSEVSAKCGKQHYENHKVQIRFMT